MEPADTQFSDALPIGTRIGSITLGGAIGQGAEGIVYLSNHDLHGRVVTKEYWPKQIVSRSANGTIQASQPGWQDAYRRGRERFIALSERLSAIEPHPNVVRFHEVVDANKTSYLVMEHIVGTSLSAVAGDYPMSPGQVHALADGLTAALVHLHAAGLTHRDIAPDNIIMSATSGAAVLIDFNAAKDEVHAASRSMQGLVKPGYSPIEQYDPDGARTAGPWSDVYSAAAVLYRVIVGKAPDDAGRRLYQEGHVKLADMAPAGYSKDFLAAVDFGLESRPEDRPQSADRWRKLLGFDGEEQAPVEPPIVVDESPRPRWYRHRAVRFGTFAAMFAAILVGAAWTFRSGTAGSRKAAAGPIVSPKSPVAAASPQAATYRPVTGFARHTAFGSGADTFYQYVAFDSSGKFVLSTHFMDKIETWDISAGFRKAYLAPPRSIFPHARNHISQSIVTADRRFMITAVEQSDDDGATSIGKIVYWDIASDGGIKYRFASDDLSDGEPEDLSASIDGSVIAFRTYQDSIVAMRRVEDRLQVTANFKFRGYESTALALSPDGTTIVTADSRNDLKFWRASGGELIRTIKIDSGKIWQLRFIDLNTIAMGQSTGNVILMKLDDNRQALIRTGKGSVADLVVFSGGRELAVLSGSGNISVWNIATRTKLASATFPNVGNTSIAVSPDGRYLAASGGGSLHFWEIERSGAVRKK